MSMVNLTSLAATLDNVTEALFFGRKIAAVERKQAASWIAGRQGLPGSYAGMFAPMPDERKGIKVFTGEAITSRAATAHILGEEACRALILLDAPVKAAREALGLATRNMLARLADAEARGYSTGTYCCGRCSCAYWRHLAAGGLAQQERRLAEGLVALRRDRLPNGKWKRFPFWYTLLALGDMDLPAAREEIRHAAPVLERRAARSPSGQFAERRRAIAERVLAKF
jgi:hypothetical protein